MKFRLLRILLLLFALLLAAFITVGERWWVAQWQRPLQVVVYPVNGDGSDAVRAYIQALSPAQFQEIGTFVGAQSARYFVRKLPDPEIRLGKEIFARPPAPPPAGRGALESLLWSLNMRYYAFSNTPFFASLGGVRLFVVYHTGQDDVPLQHSLGLRKGLTGVVHAFALPRQNSQNNVVIAHEFLHTLGASDKYDAAGNPRYPEGFAEPGDAPRYPQHAAEIMAGRRAISPEQSVIPVGLEECGIGYRTAHEINW